MSEEKAYVKDTGFYSIWNSGTREWQINAGNPIEIMIKSIQISSQANRLELPYFIDQQNSFLDYSTISLDPIQLTIDCVILKRFTNSGSIFLYVDVLKTFTEIQNPPVFSIVYFFEQMLKKNTHLDLYFSDSSGTSENYFKNTPLYWLAKTLPATSPNFVTPVTHLNVVLKSYRILQANNDQISAELNFMVLR
ncbi:MAG: hypothetical protein QXN68_00390 [Thermoplasmata archaeon]